MSSRTPPVLDSFAVFKTAGCGRSPGRSRGWWAECPSGRQCVGQCSTPVHDLLVQQRGLDSGDLPTLACGRFAVRTAR
jgi:hypothetical protein